MAYEYSGQGSKLDFPNPFYAENWFYACATGIALTGALILLIQSRHSITSHHGLASWLPLLIGLGLLLMGLRFGARMLAQLRFFFGRSEPVGLTRELNQDQAGRSEGSEFLKKILRQNALEYVEPTGPLNGLLYAWIRDLIFSPPVLQNTAQRQFQTAIAILVTLISFIVAWAGFSDPKAAAWMGLFYFLYSIFLLVRPLDYQSRARVSMNGLVVLILIAIFAPVVLPLFADQLPDITWLSLEGQTLFLLLASLLAVALYFLALMRQMNQPPRTDMARETAALSMNCHPKQLLDELDRNLQDSWIDRIPNRRYARILPVVQGNTGTFSANLIEETQPMPAERERLGLAAALSLPRFRWIAMLEGLGVLMVLLGVVWLVLFGAQFDPENIQPHLLSMLTLGIAMLALCSYCLKVGHALWARFDFTSRLVWVEMEGNFQETAFNFGNDLTSQLKTSKRIINIETMTLRVWAAELDTVVFGKRGQRAIIGLRGVPDYARQMVGHLTDFAHAQSIIVAPTAEVDLKKADVLAAMSAQAAQAAPAAPNNLLQAMAGPAAASGGTPAARPVALHCTQCGARLSPADVFCGECGFKAR